MLGKIDSYKGGMRARFDGLPDAPVSKFTMSLKGDDHGLITNATDTCLHPQTATAKFVGQENTSRKRLVPLKVKCGKKQGKGKGKRSQEQEGDAMRLGSTATRRWGSRLRSSACCSRPSPWRRSRRRRSTSAATCGSSSKASSPPAPFPARARRRSGSRSRPRSRTTNGESPPAMRQMSIAINKYGRLDTTGLPVCQLEDIQPATTDDALAGCRRSLVGEGRFLADVPEKGGAFPSEGKIYAFNGELDGRPAILAHVYGVKPAPASFTMAFVISKSKGTFGTTLKADMPAAKAGTGSITGHLPLAGQKLLRRG